MVVVVICWIAHFIFLESFIAFIRFKKRVARTRSLFTFYFFPSHYRNTTKNCGVCGMRTAAYNTMCAHWMLYECFHTVHVTVMVFSKTFRYFYTYVCIHISTFYYVLFFLISMDFSRLQIRICLSLSISLFMCVLHHLTRICF